MAQAADNRKKSSSGGKKKSTGSAASGGTRASSRAASSAKKKTSRSKSTSGSRGSHTGQSGELYREIGLILFFAVMVVLFLCNFGLIGTVGDLISSAMFGMFGLTAYILPVALFVAVLFGFANEGSPVVVQKIVAGMALFLLLGIVCDLIFKGASSLSVYDAKELYQVSSQERSCGGVVAGSLSYFLQFYLGTVGTVVIVIVLFVISLILLTERSLLRSLSEGRTRWEERSEENARAREAYEADREERRQLRLAQKEEKLAVRRERAELISRRREEAESEQYEAYDDDEYDVRTGNSAGKRHTSRSVREERERSSARRRENKKERAEERENEKILRRNRPVAGVTIDTTLPRKEERGKRDDIHEITLENGDVGYDQDAGRRETEQEDFSYQEVHLKRNPVTSAAGGRGGVVAAAWTEEPREVSGADDGIDGIESVSASVDAADNREDTSLEENTFTDETLFSQENSSVQKTGSTQKARSLQRTESPQEDASSKEASFPQETSFPVFNEVTVAREPALARQLQETAESQVDPEVEPAREGKPAEDETEIGNGTAAAKQGENPTKKYEFPPLELLQSGPKTSMDSTEELRETALCLQQTLATFGVNVTITEVSQGPSVTRYEMQPEKGVKVSRIVGLADDIKLNLAATDIRIEAPIPGKAAVGIEVPNKENTVVPLRDLLETEEFKNFPSKLAFAVGKNIAGQVVVADIAKMPHMLIAGATGSGKSVCINTLIMSILYKADPKEVKLILVDPKVVELSVYNGIPHLLIPVVTDPKKASAALNWAVMEMTDRYRKFADLQVRDLKGYNKKVQAMQEAGKEDAPQTLPQIVIIVDELADLMMVAPGEVEEAICRLAQLARACGIHLIIATQRPSVDVITGLIKANMPSRVAFAVSSGVDSRTILDMNGAEKLLGKGDMLFYPQGYSKPARIQGAFVSDNEVSDVVDFLKNQALGNVYTQNADVEKQIQSMGSSAFQSSAKGGNERDEYFERAGRFVIEKDKASIGMLERLLKIGFNRAARIIDQLAEYGVVGEEEGTKPRKVLMSLEQFEQLLEEV